MLDLAALNSDLQHLDAKLVVPGHREGVQRGSRHPGSGPGVDFDLVVDLHDRLRRFDDRLTPHRGLRRLTRAGTLEPLRPASGSRPLDRPWHSSRERADFGSPETTSWARPRASRNRATERGQSPRLLVTRALLISATTSKSPYFD